MVVVKKPNGTLCICIEAKDLNKVLKCSHYLLPTIEDILPDLSRAKVFNTFDVKNDSGTLNLTKRVQNSPHSIRPLEGTIGYSYPLASPLLQRNSKDANTR